MWDASIGKKKVYLPQTNQIFFFTNSLLTQLQLQAPYWCRECRSMLQPLPGFLLHQRQLFSDFLTTEGEQFGCGILALTENALRRRLVRRMEKDFEIEFWVTRLRRVVSIINEQKVAVLVRGSGLGHARVRAHTHTLRPSHSLHPTASSFLFKKKAWLALCVQLSTTASFKPSYVAVRTHPRTHPHTSWPRKVTLCFVAIKCAHSAVAETHTWTRWHGQIHTWTCAVITYALFYWLHRLLLSVPLSLQRLFALLCKWKKKNTKDGAITRLDAVLVPQCIASLPTPAHSQTLSL